MQMALEVMAAMDPSPGAEHARGGSQGPQARLGHHGRGGSHTSGGRKRDDVVQLVSGKEWSHVTVHTGRISTL